jgi:argininosuccinate lyase
LYSVEAVNQLVLEGASFRDAYKSVGNDIQNNTFEPTKINAIYSHEGSIGNLCNEHIVAEMNLLITNFNFEKINKSLNILLQRESITP